MRPLDVIMLPQRSRERGPFASQWSNYDMAARPRHFRLTFTMSELCRLLLQLRTYRCGAADYATGQQPTQAAQRKNHGLAQSIISSASNCIELGTSIPSTLADWRLITNSNLVDCTTGRSAVFPLENPSDIDAYQPIHVRQAVAVCHQTTSPSEFS